MAVPAPAIPTGNAYTVNVAAPAGDASPLRVFALAAATLLRRWKIPVRMHLAGDSAPVNALRARLTAVGGRPSAFSPAPSPNVPGEGFWKTSLIVVENPDATTPAARFWADERAQKKVDWDPLMIALGHGADAPFPDTLTPAQIARPDLWILARPDALDASGLSKESATSETKRSAGGSRDIVQRWVDAGAGAVCLISRDEVLWHTGSAVFGRSAGARARLVPPHPSTETATAPRARHTQDTQDTQDTCGTPDENRTARLLTPAHLGVFAAGVTTGLMRDLLSENLFDKTLLRVERTCLEMRPLRLGVAVIDGIAALAAPDAPHAQAAQTTEPTRTAGTGPAPGAGGGFAGFAERAEALTVRLKGPPPRPWAHKGR